VAVFCAALRRAADTTFDGRSRAQVMADTLVQRIAGTPAAVASTLIDSALADKDSWATLRRLYASPKSAPPTTPADTPPHHRSTHHRHHTDQPPCGLTVHTVNGVNVPSSTW
jgi:hypothetical protein